MQLDPHAIHVYTDGSCFKNPGGLSGCAADAYFPDHLQRDPEQIVEFGCSESNNSRMELLACIRALEWVRDNRPWPSVTRIQIITDSDYIVSNLHRARRWKQNGWRNADDEPKRNSDLWDQLLKAHEKAGIKVTFHWIPGKKEERTKRIDKAAKQAAKSVSAKTGASKRELTKAAKRQLLKKDTGFHPGAVSRSKVTGVTSRYAAKGDVAVIHIFQKDKVHRSEENRIKFDLLDETASEYRTKHYAYSTAQIAFVLHRQHSYRVRFNSNLKYPQIVEVIEEVQ